VLQTAVDELMMNVIYNLFILMLVASMTVQEDSTQLPGIIFTTRPVPKLWMKDTSSMGLYPNPQTASAGCNRVEKSWICDPNRLLPVDGGLFN